MMSAAAAACGGGGWERARPAGWPCELRGTVCWCTLQASLPTECVIERALLFIQRDMWRCGSVTAETGGSERSSTQGIFRRGAC